MQGDEEAPGDEGGEAHERAFRSALVGALADGIAVVGPEGTICFANEAYAAMVGESLSELIGSDAMSRVHPDDRTRAIDGLDYGQQFPGRASYALYRVRARHGTGWLDVEVMSSVFEWRGHDHIVAVIRDASSRRAVHQALQSVASGQPLEKTVDLVVQAVVRRWSDAAVAVVLPDLEGGHDVHSAGLREELVAHARGERRGADGRAPWDLAAGASPVLVVDAADVPPSVAAAAAEQGLAAFGAAPVGDAGAGAGCIIVWFPHASIAHLEFAHAAGELTEVLSIALGRRNLHREMWAAARYDALTGLLNRFGFMEAFQACVRDARSDPSVVAAAFFVDLDGLKQVNDAGGHAAGDRVLTHLARRLRDVAQEGICGRLGGDEFAVVVHVPASGADAACAALADDLVKRLAVDRDPPVSASIGVAIDDGEAEPATLLERADAAMYRAKLSGKAAWSR